MLQSGLPQAKGITNPNSSHRLRSLNCGLANPTPFARWPRWSITLFIGFVHHNWRQAPTALVTFFVLRRLLPTEVPFISMSPLNRTCTQSGSCLRVDSPICTSAVSQEGQQEGQQCVVHLRFILPSGSTDLPFGVVSWCVHGLGSSAFPPSHHHAPASWSRNLPSQSIEPDRAPLPGGSSASCGRRCSPCPQTAGSAGVWCPSPPAPNDGDPVTRSWEQSKPGRMPPAQPLRDLSKSLVPKGPRPKPLKYFAGWVLHLGPSHG